MFKKYVCNFGLICIAVILIQSSILPSEGKAKSPVTVDWTKLLKAWEEYVNYPSSENAKKVSRLLPDSGHVEYSHAEEIAIDTIFSAFPILERQIYYSDREAVNLAFHLISISDGEVGETLDIILGALIRINARLFLQELLLNRPLVPELDGLVGNFGPIYTLTDEAYRLETNLRIEVLKKVKDSKLRKIRDECIKELEQDSEGEEE